MRPRFKTHGGKMCMWKTVCCRRDNNKQKKEAYKEKKCNRIYMMVLKTEKSES